MASIREPQAGSSKGPISVLVVLNLIQSSNAVIVGGSCVSVARLGASYGGRRSRQS